MHFSQSKFNFLIGVSSNLSQQKSPTAEILGIYFLGTIVPRKYMPKISAVAMNLKNPNQKIVQHVKVKYLNLTLIYKI